MTRPSAPNPTWAALLKRLKALPELPMRREVLGEQMLRRSPAEVLEFFQEVIAGADRRRPAHLIAKEALDAWILAAIEQGPVYELLAEVYRLAVEAEADGVAHMLMMAQPKRGPVGPEVTPGDVDLARLTLGERKFMARGHDRNRLERLLLDPDPAVVHNLLRNPNVLEKDVVRLASRRPVRAEVLREVHTSRWGTRYAIRKALVCNPYTPTELSLKLVAFLLRRDLKMVARDGTLHKLVSAEAARLAAARRASAEEKDGDEPADGPDA